MILMKIGDSMNCPCPETSKRFAMENKNGYQL